jgi:hypothetical protein
MFVNKNMENIKNLVSYWLNSLIDADRIGLSSDLFKTSDQYCTVNLFELANGQLNLIQAQKLFKIQQNLQGKNKKDLNSNYKTETIHILETYQTLATESSELLIGNLLNDNFLNKEIQKNDNLANEADFGIQVLICPILLSKKTYNQIKITPLWIPARLLLDGTLIVDEESLPWISRQYLEPIDSDNIAIGLVDDFERFLCNHAPPTQNWEEFWAYCEQMLKTVTGMGFNNFFIQEYEVNNNAFIVIEDVVQGASTHIKKLYDSLKEKNDFGALFKNFTKPTSEDIKQLLSLEQQITNIKKHLGQMTGKYALSLSQRESLSHFFSLKDGEILAINGPPGTGKTTLLQSVVASLWIKSILEKSPPPVIVVASTNNQAVTNVITSFGDIGNSSSDSPLHMRWLPEIKSYGLYLCSKGKDKDHFQCITSDKNTDFFAFLERKDYLEQAVPFFLEKCRFWSKKTFENPEKALIFLKSELINLIKSIWIEIDKLSTSSLNIELIHTIESELDQKLRHQAFGIATHIWECTWLIETQRQIKNPILAKRSLQDEQEFQKKRWQRYAMLAPCFVSTFYMTPKFFSVSQNDEYLPMLDFIDLLIVDEAGQVSSEIAGATFALAKKALVVGDIQQIEPVWSIPKAVDLGNLKKDGLLQGIYNAENMEQFGLSASSGCVMKVAQKASFYRKYEPQRGMFLSEHRRCAKTIISYCNELCYEGKLEPKKEDTKPENMPKLNDGFPLPHFGFLHTVGQAQKICGSWQNEKNGEVIADWLFQQLSPLKKHYDKELSEICAVITPFKKQASLIKSLLIQRDSELSKLTVGTVHALQGAERPIIIFSSVYDSNYRGSYFFDRNKNMLNVAVSRAKDSFLVFGDIVIFQKQLSKSRSELLPSELLALYLFSQENNRLPTSETQFLCPVCQNHLEKHPYFKDGQQKELLRCSDAKARQHPNHDKAVYYFSNGVWWSPKYGELKNITEL